MSENGSELTHFLGDDCPGGHMTFEEFKEIFRRHHTCGADILGMALTFSSDCPRCCPDLLQWKEDCLEFYWKGATIRFSGWWYNSEEMAKMSQASLRKSKKYKEFS